MHGTNFDKLCLDFHLVTIFFKLSWDLFFWHVLLRSVLCNPRVFWDFLAVFLLLISNLTSSWSEKGCDVYPFNMLKYILQSRIWSILGNVPCKLKKNMYSVVGWSVHANYIHSINGIVEVYHVLIHFLSALSIHFWYRGIDDSSYNVDSFIFSWYILKPRYFSLSGVQLT